MKKFLALLFVAILPFALFTACSDDDDPKTPPTAQELAAAVDGFYGVTIKGSGQADVTGSITATPTTDNKINFAVDAAPALSFTLPAVALKGNSVDNVTFDQTVKANVIVSGVQTDGVDVKVVGSVKKGVMTSTITYTIGDNKTVLTVNGTEKVKTLADKAVGTYPSVISVKVNTELVGEPIPATVIITKASKGKAVASAAELINAELINLELKGFIFPAIEGEIPIHVLKVPLKKGEGEKVLIEEHKADLPIDFAGPSAIGKTAPLTINGVIENGKLALTLNIDGGEPLNMMVIDVKVDSVVK